MLNESVTQKRIKKLITMFNVLERGLPIPFGKVTKENIEEFVTDLRDEKFTQHNGKAYSESTIADIKKFLKQFWKWFEGDNESYPKKVSWIKTKIPRDKLPTPKEILRLDQLKKLASSFTKVKYKIAVLMLFDSGFRISEFLSLRKRDITWEVYDEGEKCFWVECKVSKTELRKVPIPLFTDDLNSFFRSIDYEQLNDDDIVFDFNDRVFSNWLKKKARVLFNKNITPHCLRHSSATYYAFALEGNNQALANRYGWKQNSPILNTYIRLSGIYQRVAPKKIYANETTKLKKEMEELKDLVNKITNDPKIVAKLHKRLNNETS